MSLSDGEQKAWEQAVENLREMPPTPKEELRLPEAAVLDELAAIGRDAAISVIAENVRRKIENGEYGGRSIEDFSETTTEGLKRAISSQYPDLTPDVIEAGLVSAGLPLLPKYLRETEQIQNDNAKLGGMFSGIFAEFGHDLFKDKDTPLVVRGEDHAMNPVEIVRRTERHAASAFGSGDETVETTYVETHHMKHKDGRMVIEMMFRWNVPPTSESKDAVSRVYIARTDKASKMGYSWDIARPYEISHLMTELTNFHKTEKIQ